MDQSSRHAVARSGRVLLCVAFIGCASTVQRSQGAVTLVPQRDSFALLVQGKRVGTEVSSLERTATGWNYSTTTTMPGVEQATEVRAGSDGGVERMHQRLHRGNAVAVSDLTYAGGRITGTIQLPTQAGGVEVIPIDTVAVAGVVDDNFVAAVQPSLAWAPGASVTIPVFVGGKNATQQWTFRVLGTENVTVPAGTFPAYKVALHDEPRVLLTWIEVAAPHRVLKRVPVGSPLELVRLP
jgi:hypothetical protein